jgi:hypothetical protein
LGVWDAPYYRDKKVVSVFGVFVRRFRPDLLLLITQSWRSQSKNAFHLSGIDFDSGCTSGCDFVMVNHFLLLTLRDPLNVNAQHFWIGCRLRFLLFFFLYIPGHKASQNMQLHAHLC